MTAELALHAVSCVRGGRLLFGDLSLRVPAGQLLRVQGANGAGKTSLLRMLCGLLQPTEGQVMWRGQPVDELREEYGRELIYLGHAAALKDDLSPLENLEMACALGGHTARREESLGALQAAGLRGFEHVPARRLSQGQRRRAALARLAMGIHRPLWILDEPFNALDTAATGWLEGLMSAHLARAGTVVLTSHQGVPLPDAPTQVLAL